jgi:ABC-type nitrate/sulfonate/bicarbonate transport system substrate-binding protein
MKEKLMFKVFVLSLICVIGGAGKAASQAVRGAFPSPSIQILPMMVGAERGFYKREGLDMELVFVRGAATAVQALLVPTEKGVDLMAQWQAIALNTRPKRKPSEYMDLRFVKEAMSELGLK